MASFQLVFFFPQGVRSFRQASFEISPGVIILHTLWCSFIIIIIAIVIRIARYYQVAGDFENWKLILIFTYCDIDQSGLISEANSSIFGVSNWKAIRAGAVIFGRPIGTVLKMKCATARSVAPNNAPAYYNAIVNAQKPLKTAKIIFLVL